MFPLQEGGSFGLRLHIYIFFLTARLAMFFLSSMSLKKVLIFFLSFMFIALLRLQVFPCRSRTFLSLKGGFSKQRWIKIGTKPPLLFVRALKATKSVSVKIVAKVQSRRYMFWTSPTQDSLLWLLTTSAMVRWWAMVFMWSKFSSASSPAGSYTRRYTWHLSLLNWQSEGPYDFHNHRISQ